MRGKCGPIGLGIPNPYPLDINWGAGDVRLSLKRVELKCEYCGSLGEKRKCENCGAPVSEEAKARPDHIQSSNDYLYPLIDSDRMTFRDPVTKRPLAVSIRRAAERLVEISVIPARDADTEVRRIEEYFKSKYPDVVVGPVGASPPRETMGSTHPTQPVDGSMTHADIETLEKASSRGIFSEMLRFICFWTLRR